MAEEARHRVESNRWDPERDWQMLATDCWQVGRLVVQFGELEDARVFLERALSIWQTHGHQLAHIQTRAIAGLREQLADIRRRTNRPNGSANAV